MYATDDVRRQTDVRQKHRLMPPPYRGGGIITLEAEINKQLQFVCMNITTKIK